MKIKFLTLLLSAFTIILSSCGDDDDKKLTNEFTMNGEDYDLTEGSYSINDEDETLYEWNIFLNGYENDAEHKFSFFLYTTDGESPNGTYTYQQNGGANDKFVSHFSSYVPEGHELEAGNIKSGTVKITKTGDTFNITFDIIYLIGEEEVRVKGAMKDEFEMAMPS